MRILFACCVLWGLPTAALTATEYIQPAPVEATAAPSTSTLNNDVARADEPSIEKRVLALLALACALGLIVGRRDPRPRGTQLRLHNKPKKMPPTILVPPGPAPYLVPGDSPKATRRAGSTVPVLRQTPDGIPSSGLIDYLAPFSASAEGGEGTRVDYLLEAGEAEVIDASGEGDDSS